MMNKRTKRLKVRHCIEFITIVALLTLLLFPFPLFVKKSILIPLALVINIISVLDYTYSAYNMGEKELTDSFIRTGSIVIVMPYFIASVLAFYVFNKPRTIVFVLIFVSLYAFIFYLTQRFYHRINQLEGYIEDSEI